LYLAFRGNCDLPMEILGLTIQMQDVYSLFGGVTSSLIATVIVVLFAKWRWPTLFFKISGSFFFGHGVDYCFSNQNEAKPYILSSFQDSRKVMIYTMRGFSVTETGRPFRAMIDRNDRDVKILVSDPGDTPKDNPYLLDRVKEYPSAPPLGAYRSKINSSIDNIKLAIMNNDHLECKLHSEPAYYRFFIFDDVAYLSFFEIDKSGTDLPVFRVRRSSPLYKNLEKIFNTTWNHKSRFISELNYVH
jgi:hypothetical protein